MPIRVVSCMYSSVDGDAISRLFYLTVFFPLLFTHVTTPHQIPCHHHRMMRAKVRLPVIVMMIFLQMTMNHRLLRSPYLQIQTKMMNLLQTTRRRPQVQMKMRTMLHYLHTRMKMKGFLRMRNAHHDAYLAMKSLNHLT